MAQSVKCPLHKPEDLSLGLQHKGKTQVWWYIPIYPKLWCKLRWEDSWSSLASQPSKL